MIEVNVPQLKEVQAALKALSDRIGNLRRPLSAIGREILLSVQRNFQEQGRPEKWQDLSPTTKAIRAKKGKYLGGILQVTGELFRSINYRADSQSVTIGVKKKYAATMQYGAKKGQFGVSRKGRPIPWGNIPPRPYLMIHTKDWAEIRQIIREYMVL